MKKKKVVVQWKPGSRIKSDPEALSKEISALLAENDGHVTAEQVLAAARSPRSKLHREFEWDDRAAAEECRIQQARYICRSFVVIRPEAPKFPTRWLHLERLPQPEGGNPVRAYGPIEDILVDPERRAVVLQNALNELMRCRTKYSQLQELSIVWRELDRVLETATP